jgi:hypothetical protein
VLVHFGIAFCETNWHAACCKLVLTKLRGGDGASGAMAGHV